jgi:hypothetical protein
MFMYNHDATVAPTKPMPTTANLTVFLLIGGANLCELNTALDMMPWFSSLALQVRNLVRLVFVYQSQHADRRPSHLLGSDHQQDDRARLCRY